MTKQARADPSSRPTSAVACRTNQYPAPGHSFIPRELHALEALGWTVHLFSHRRVGALWVDAATQDEAGLICAAHREHPKNSLLLIAAAALPRTRGIGFLMTIIGGGALRSQVERRIAQQGLDACVVLKGWGTQQEVLTHLQHSKARVLSSGDEGLPVAVMAPYTAGRPVLAANVGSMRERVETGVTGWLAAAHDPVALADALQGCLNAAAAILQALGANARERVLGDRSELAAHLLGAALRRAATAGVCNRARCAY